METFKLEKSDLLKIYNESSEAGKKYLEEKIGSNNFKLRLEDRLDSFEACCVENGVDPDDVIPFANPKNGDEKCINAFAKLIQIDRAYNQRKKKDWKNSNQPKYYPWWWMDGRSGSGLSLYVVVNVRSYTFVASRLCVLSREHAEHIAKTFPDIYEDYMTE